MVAVTKSREVFLDLWSSLWALVDSDVRVQKLASFNHIKMSASIQAEHNCNDIIDM